MQINVAQMGDIRDGVGELWSAQRAPGPVREAVGLVKRVAGDALHELIVGDGIAVAQHHGGDLGIGDGMRNDACFMPADFDVLTRGMEYFEDIFIRHEREKGSEIEARGKRVDDHGLIRARHLRHAELRIVGRFAQEFGIDRHERIARHACAGVRELFRRGDRLHGR